MHPPPAMQPQPAAQEPAIVQAARQGDPDRIRQLLRADPRGVDAAAPATPQQTALKTALDMAERAFKELFGDPVPIGAAGAGSGEGPPPKKENSFLSNFFEVIKLLLDGKADVAPLANFLERVMDAAMKHPGKDEILEELLKAGAVPALMQALSVQADKAPGPPAVHRVCALLCKTFWHIARGSNARKDACSEAVPAIVKALTRHGASPEVAADASLALAAICESSVWRQDYVHKQGALGALVAALQLHRATPRAAARLGEALAALAAVDSGIKDACAAAPPAPGGALAALVAALRGCVADDAACTALSSACNVIVEMKKGQQEAPTTAQPRRDAFAAAGGPAALEAAAQRHPALRATIIPPLTPSPAAAGGAAAAGPGGAGGAGAGGAGTGGAAAGAGGAAGGAGGAGGAGAGAGPFPWLGQLQINQPNLGLHMLFPRRR